MYIVIGRGIAGLAAAWELARAGRGPITLIGPDEGRNAATTAAVGLSAVKGLEAGHSALMAAKIAGHQMLPGWLAELEAESGIRIARRFGGTFGGAIEPWINRTGFEAIHTRVFHRVPPTTPRVEVLDLVALPPELKNLSRVLPQVQGVFRFPHDGWFDPRATLVALTAALRTRAVRIQSDSVIRIVPHPDRGVVVEAERGSIRGDDVILAAGWWSTQILNNSGCYHAAQRAFAGETLVADVDDGIPELVASFGKENLIRVEGQLLGGSNTYEVAPDGLLGPTPETRAALASRFAFLAPGLSWPRTLFGVRGRVRDRLPLFGPLLLPGGQRQITLMTAYYKNGLQLAPHFARLFATSAPLVPFSPARFSL